MNLTETAARMVADLSYDDLSSKIVEKTKLLILDHLGCAIGGSIMPEAARLRTYLEQGDAGGMCAVYGGQKMTPANAAHANAHAACMLSLDDSYIRYGHPGCSILPSALAIAEKQQSSGRELITATVAAYEMSMRLGIAAQASPERDEIVKGYASWQTYGSTSVAGKLYDLSADEIASAFGMTALHAPPPFLRKFHGRPMNWLKNNYGWACKAGVTSVELVLAGFEGNRTIFDGPDGYWAMMGSDRFDPAVFVEPYANKSYVMDIGFKAYSGCRWSHTAIDCIRELMARDGVTRDNIVAIEIETVGEFVRDLDGDWPETTVEALFRTPYLVALELHGKSSMTGLKEADLLSSTLKHTVGKISMSVLQGADEKFIKDGLLPVRMTVKSSNGERVQKYAELPTGHPDGPPFGHKEVEEKFLSLAVPVVGEKKANAIAAHVLMLEEQEHAVLW